MSGPFPPSTLFDALLDVASEGRGRTTFHMADGQVVVAPDELAADAVGGARALAAMGVRPGDVVGLLGPNRPEWLRWAFSTWAAGAVLVAIPFPLHVRDPEGFRRQVRALTGAAGCRRVLADPGLLEHVPDDLAVSWDFPHRREDGAAFEPPPPPAGRAVIQFTSGSTAMPKAAVLPHAAVLAATRTLQLFYRPTDQDHLLSWLPFFHDNGLFLHMVTPVLLGLQSHIIPTERFARNPLVWFRVVAEVGGTLTSGPSSGWAAALRTAMRRPDGIDLSTLELAVLSAEMVQPAVVELLIEDGRRFGLRPNVLANGYGMAEATLSVAVSPRGGGIRMEEIDVGALAGGRAVPARGGPRKRVASSGPPMPDVEVRVVGPDGGDRGEREVGEVHVRAPSLMAGYIGENAPQPFVDGWLRTGDLGYRSDGELFVTGRSKDVLIVFGRNYLPEDIEWAAGAVEGVRPGRCIAFSPPDGSDGEVYVAIEPTPGSTAETLVTRVRQAVFNSVGIPLRDVLILPKGSIPMTTSGKLQRGEVRARFARGQLSPVLSGAPS